MLSARDKVSHSSGMCYFHTPNNESRGGEVHPGPRLLQQTIDSLYQDPGRVLAPRPRCEGERSHARVAGDVFHSWAPPHSDCDGCMCILQTLHN